VSLFNVRSVWSRGRLLGGCSLLCLTFGMAHPTVALERRNANSEDSFYERFHVSLEGGWLVNKSGDNFAFSGDLAAGGSLTPGRDGRSLGVEVGGAFNPLYDWRASWRSNTFRTATGSGSSTDGPVSNSATASNTLRFQTFDGEIGYRPPGTPLRLFAGARVLKSTNTVSYDYEQQQPDKFGTSSTTGHGTHDAELFGVGPRAGLELTVPFPEPRVFASLNGSVAAIFAKRDHTFAGTESFSGFFFPPIVTIPPSTTTVVQDFSRHLTIFNAEATATLGYRLSNNARVELGYRVQYFSNMLPEIRQVNVGNVSGVVSGNTDVLVHGPLAKLTIALP
jgi:hypothetical protein